MARVPAPVVNSPAKCSPTESGNEVAGGMVSVGYDPIVCLEQGVVHGAAAVPRWHAAGRPGGWDDLLPSVESDDLIGVLGSSVVDQVAAAIGPLDPPGRPASIVIPLPARWLRDADLPDVVSRTLARHGVRPESISFEIAESAAASDRRSAAATLHLLRGLGCEVGVSGFGATVASLQLLDEVAVDYVKVHRARVAQMLVDPDGLTAVDGLLRAARERGIPTVADGVEQREQAVWLRDLGCDLAQGPWFGRPQDQLIHPDVHRCGQ